MPKRKVPKRMKKQEQKEETVEEPEVVIDSKPILGSLRFRSDQPNIANTPKAAPLKAPRKVGSVLVLRQEHIEVLVDHLLKTMPPRPSSKLQEVLDVLRR